MKIQYFGHSCFRIISEMGTTVVCDPFDEQMVGLPLPTMRCDVVTVSHHQDHDCTTNIIGSPAILDQVVSGGADDVAVDSKESFHDDSNGTKRGKNIVFTFVVDGIKIAHMGDIGCRDNELVEFVKDVDVMLLPVGGVYTVNAIDAKWYVDNAHPKIVVPMHYGTNKHKFKLDTIDNFTSLFDSGLVNYYHTCDLVLDDKPSDDEPRIVVLDSYKE